MRSRQGLLLVLSVLTIGIVGAAIIGKYSSSQKGYISVVLNLPDYDGLTVRLDNSSINVRKIVGNYPVHKGDHSLTITKPGYRPFSSPFTVATGQTIRIAANLEQTAIPNLTDLSHVKPLNQSLSGWNISNVVYFYDHVWAVANVEASYGQPAILVARYDAGTRSWEAKFGPGTLIPESSLGDFPKAVSAYLQQNNFVGRGL